MTLSLNEVEATAKKATRGAGYPWGLAEAAGKAVRWLCAQGAGGCEALAVMLRRFDGAPLADIGPVTALSEWAAPGGTLCPLMTGTALSARARDAERKPIRAREAVAPEILFALAANVAAHCKREMTLSWPGGTAITDGARLCLQGEAPGQTAAWVRLECGGTLTSPVQTATRADPQTWAWDALNAFAHRTYAPATEESRLKGAGAGTKDMD